MIATAILFFGLMIPPAMAWVAGYLIFKRSTFYRLAIVAGVFVGIAILFWPVSLLLMAPTAIASLAVVGALEWAVVRDRA